MLCSIKNPTERRYVIRMWIMAALCVLFSAVAAVVFRHSHPHGVLAYLVAVLPALPIMGALIYTGVYLAEEKDEFQRNLLVQCMLGGIGGTLATTTAWGYLEAFVHVPHLQTMWIFPIFWLFVGISVPVVYRRYR